MNIEVAIHPTATTTGEIAQVELRVPGLPQAHLLDVKFSELLDRSPIIPQPAMDFLTTATVLYGIDKAVSRARTADRWTRELEVEIPVQQPARWQPTQEVLSDCMSFLTGDLWGIRFSQAARPIAQPDPQRNLAADGNLAGHAVSLFSGGLDSYIGAIDFLEQAADTRLILAGHSDRAVKGPKSDQKELYDTLLATYPGRVDLVQVRIGLLGRGAETSFRSRSLIFIALGLYLSEVAGANAPLLIPENGAIALNPPLTPTRRGSCSTRTVHPHFLELLQSVLQKARWNRAFENPYAFQTKGQMVDACRNAMLLQDNYPLSLSCGKAGHRRAWRIRTAKGCGRCVPCLFRRASLHVSGWDDEEYGFDVLDPNLDVATLREDFHALLSFIHRRPSDEEVANMLIANGPVPINRLKDYVQTVQELRQEVSHWIRQKGPANVRALARIQAR